MPSKKLLKDFIIREMQEKDIPEVNRIYNAAIKLRTATAHMESLPIYYHEDWYHNHIKGNNPILIAEKDQNFLGWNALSDYRSGREALRNVRETSCYIDQAYWGRGIASELMSKMIEMAKANGIKILVTFIMDANPVSVQLMDKFGFKLWGRLPQIIEMETENYDHLIFGKNL